MASDVPAPLPLGRLAGIGAIIFAANAALLVLQLVAGRLLAPFVGSSLETWTSIIGVFLTGIALGNALGGKLADRLPSPRTLGIVLAVGALAALWMVAFPMLLASTGVHKSIPLGPRIPLLAFVLCLPAGFVLSLLTPLAIKLGLPDVSKTGRVAGMIFALSTLGCLLGNYVTGFYLMKTFTINVLVFLSAGGLAALAAGTLLLLGNPSPLASLAAPPPQGEGLSDSPPSFSEKGDGGFGSQANPHAFSDIRQAYLIVFLASFGGMTLELTASRVLAQFLGVSLFTWTGIIGVMLAGTALGNLTGGMIADRVNREGSSLNPRSVLACTLMLAGGSTVLLFVSLAVLQKTTVFDYLEPITQVMAWTFSLFFLPMFLLGMVSPQVIRLAVPDVAHVGRVAGRVYAWSTTGAIVGTFAAGYVLLSSLGMHWTLLLVALVLTLTSLLVAKVWDDNTMLYTFSIVLGAITGGFVLTSRPTADEDLVAQVESNYYTIRVTYERKAKRGPDGKYIRDEKNRKLYYRTDRLNLNLDHLLHSTVDIDHPEHLHYQHEQVQMEFLRGARLHNPNPRVLVIGGGGYTFPRYAMLQLPEARMDVVEIDPKVTEVAQRYLGLKTEDFPNLHITHMDGRQFVDEKVAPGTYDLVIQDAVNDLSVPSHLLTKEYNESVKKALKPDGVYLLTVIDAVDEHGQLWKAAMHTLRQSYPADNVALLTAENEFTHGRQVYVIYASNKALDLAGLERDLAREQRPIDERRHALAIQAATASVAGVGGTAHALAAVLAGETTPPVFGRTFTFFTKQVPPDKLQRFLDKDPIILTDQFAPTDNLMAEVFRHRAKERPAETPDE